MPGSPTSSTTEPCRARAESSALVSAAISASRPTSGDAVSRSMRSPASAPTLTAATGCDFPLTRNGSSTSTSKTVRERSSHGRRREDLAGLGLAHDPGGEVDRVALDAERPAERRAEVTGEHGAPVDPDAQRQDADAVHDAPGRTEHPLLVVVRAARRAGGEHDLAAVAVDVGLEERHVVPRRRLLHVADRLVEGGREGVRTLLRQQRVRPGELHERHGDLPVLGVAGRLLQVLADRDRQGGPDVEAVRRPARDDDEVVEPSGARGAGSRRPSPAPRRAGARATPSPG